MNLDSLAQPIISHEENNTEIMRRKSLFNKLNVLCKQEGEDNALFKLCNILLKPTPTTIEMTLIDTLIHGRTIFPAYPPLPQNTIVQKDILLTTRNLLEKSGQLAYLESNAKIFFEQDWEIFLEVQYYYRRPRTQIAFHKDTFGRTLFVILAFNNEENIMGPECVIHPASFQEHIDYISDKLPPYFIKNLYEQYEKSREKIPRIISTKLQPYGSIGFTDELIYHSTPNREHRDKIVPYELDRFLLSPTFSKYLAYKKARKAYFFKKLILNVPPNALVHVRDLITMGFEEKNIAILRQGISEDEESIPAIRVLSFSNSRGYTSYYRSNLDHNPLVGLVALIDTAIRANKPSLSRAQVEKYPIIQPYLEQLFPNMNRAVLAYYQDDADSQDAIGRTVTLEGPHGRRLHRQMSDDLNKGVIRRPAKQLGKDRQFLRIWTFALPKGFIRK